MSWFKRAPTAVDVYDVKAFYVMKTETRKSLKEKVQVWATVADSTPSAGRSLREKA